MKTYQEVMDEAKVRYRHAFQNSTIISFLNAVLRDLWKKVPRESLPAVIICDKSKIYPLPAGVKRRYIKSVTFGQPGKDHRPLTQAGFDEVVQSGYYVLLEKQIIINEDEDDPNIYILMIYYDKVVPEEVTEDNLDDPVDIDESYEEAVIVGLLEKIAGARKDVKMKNNYANDYNSLLGDFVLEAVDSDPDYPSCKDELPRRSRYGRDLEE